MLESVYKIIGMTAAGVAKLTGFPIIECEPVQTLAQSIAALG